MSRTACRCGVPVRTVLGVGLLFVATLLRADPPGFDAARAFGARQSVMALRISPDGTQVAYVAPTKDHGTVLITGRLEPEFKGRPIMLLDGQPFRLLSCHWVSNQRLVCQIYGIVPDNTGTAGLLPVSRLVAVNADGSNVQTLATRRNANSRGYFLYDGEIIDYLPDEDGAVLMSREYTPDTHTNSHIGSDKEGLGVDWVDTRNLTVKSVVPPSLNVFEYLSDGRGTVRIMGMVQHTAGYLSGKYLYYYRAVGSTDWQPLAQYDEHDRSGFTPIAVDHDLNVVYGFRRVDGHRGLYTIKLDQSLQEQLIYSRPDVDVSGVLRIGRRERVVGADYITDRRQTEVFDPQIKQLLASLSHALPHQLLRVTDSSVDESKLLVFAGSDTDPGVYYLFDRKSHQLATFLVVRGDLEGVKLATVRPVTYPGDGGVMVPGYLTLPPGKEDAHGLPAIVLPHGGPESRDTWGFDWLPQFFANRGYAVLQPEFRGSAGYGDAWFQQNGFHSWRIAIGDVLAAGRWLVAQGIADPARLGIVGWSYGGYAALQSAVVDPALFKGVVAIAPVTDLPALVEERRHWGNYEMVKDYVGEGPHTHEGSPIEHASSFAAPVLLVHGTNDRNVGYDQSARMADKLKSAGKQAELITFKDLDHQLDDSAARAELLRRSDEFLQAAFKGAAATH